MKRELKVFLIFLCCCIMIPLILIILFNYDNEKLTSLGNISDYNLTNEYITIIDDVQQTKNKTTIYGCSLKLGENLDYVNKQYVLVDDENRVIGINTVVTDRTSATEYFNDGFNYDKSGLNGQFATKYINNEVNYKIGILIKEKNGATYLVISDRIIGGKN